MSTSLITGFPGFIGARLVRALLDDDPELNMVALVEPKMADKAREQAPDRLEVIEGDITDRRLKLSDEDYERLTGQVMQVYHLAAIYDLAVPIQAAQAVNVDGTGNILDFCLACDGLERLHYVSTAYVAGMRTGVVYEHELSLGQDFKNHYESTKFQAELWVRKELDRIPTTIYRPAIVVGDSQTGETQKFDGPYYILRTLSRIAKGPIAQFGRSQAPFNVVPVDFIVDALQAAAREPGAVGQTLHLVDPEPVTAADLWRILSREYLGREPSVRVPPKLIETALRSKAVRSQFAGAPPESIRYLNHPVRFDTRRAGDILAAAGLRVPRFEEYVGPMVDFFRGHEDDPAFAPGAAA